MLYHNRRAARLPRFTRRRSGTTQHGQPLMACGDVEANPGPWAEDYTVTPTLIPAILQGLNSPTPVADLFCESHNSLFPPLFGLHPDNDAYERSWYHLMPLWANPPFQDLPRVTSKIKRHGAHLLLVVPGWKKDLPPLWALSERQYRVPDGPTYLSKTGALLPQRHWPTWVLYIKHLPGSPHSLLPPPPIPASAFSVFCKITYPTKTSCAPSSGQPYSQKPTKKVTYLNTGTTKPAPHPATGRGESLLSCGVESNPGPDPGRASSSLSWSVISLLQRWALTPFFDLWVEPGPDEGPSGSSRTWGNTWVYVTCLTCQTELDLRPQGMRPLIRHISTCAQLHHATGRGSGLLTSGDVEANPGPPNKPYGPSQKRPQTCMEAQDAAPLPLLPPIQHQPQIDLALPPQTGMPLAIDFRTHCHKEWQ